MPDVDGFEVRAHLGGRLRREGQRAPTSRRAARSHSSSCT
jgi:hypothetical protein